MIKFTAPEDRIVRSATSKIGEKVSAVELQIFSLLREDPAYTYPALEKTRLSQKTVYTKINALKEKGILKRVGFDTKGYWNIIENK